MANHSRFWQLTCFFNLTLYLCVCGHETTLNSSLENAQENFSSLDADGIELLTEVPAERILNGATQKNEDNDKLCEACVENGSNPSSNSGKIRDNLGDACDCSSNGSSRTGVLMHNEKEKYVCSVCCPNQYYSQSRKCEKCADRSANQNRSLRASCIPDPYWERTDTTTSTSTTNTTTPTSTTNTTTPASATNTTAKNDKSGWTPEEIVKWIVAVIVGFVAVIVAVIAVGIYFGNIKNREKFYKQGKASKKTTLETSV